MTEEKVGNNTDGDDKYTIFSIEDFSARLNQLHRDATDFQNQSIQFILDQTSPEVFATAYDSIFRFFELHAETQLLGPFLEILDDHFPDYLESLVQSVNRKPTTSTLLMLNRHLNDELEDQVRQILMESLRGSTRNENATQVLHDEANHYWERQNYLDWRDLELEECNRHSSSQLLLSKVTQKLDGQFVRLRGVVCPHVTDGNQTPSVRLDCRKPTE